MADINLIPSEEINIRTSSKRQTRALTVAIIFLVVTSAATTFLFSAWALSISQINSEVSKQSQLAAQIDSYAKKEKLNKFVADQAQVATQAIGEQVDYQSIFADFRGLMPAGIKLSDSSATTQTLTVAGTADNSVALSTFISKAIDASTNPESHFSSVTIATLTGRDDGTFQFSVAMNLKNTKVKAKL